MQNILKWNKDYIFWCLMALWIWNLSQTPVIISLPNK